MHINYPGNKGIIQLLSNVKELFESHTGNKDNPHNITKLQVGLENVEDKSSETIRSELTSNNISNALGYVPSGVTVRTWTDSDIEG